MKYDGNLTDLTLSRQNSSLIEHTYIEALTIRKANILLRTPAEGIKRRRHWNVKYSGTQLPIFFLLRILKNIGAQYRRLNRQFRALLSLELCNILLLCERCC